MIAPMSPQKNLYKIYFLSHEFFVILFCENHVRNIFTLMNKLREALVNEVDCRRPRSFVLLPMTALAAESYIVRLTRYEIFS